MCMSSIPPAALDVDHFSASSVVSALTRQALARGLQPQDLPALTQITNVATRDPRRAAEIAVGVQDYLKRM